LAPPEEQRCTPSDEEHHQLVKGRGKSKVDTGKETTDIPELASTQKRGDKSEKTRRISHFSFFGTRAHHDQAVLDGNDSVHGSSKLAASSHNKPAAIHLVDGDQCNVPESHETRLTVASAPTSPLAPKSKFSLGEIFHRNVKPHAKNDETTTMTRPTIVIEQSSNTSDVVQDGVNLKNLTAKNTEEKVVKQRRISHLGLFVTSDRHVKDHNETAALQGKPPADVFKDDISHVGPLTSPNRDVKSVKEKHRRISFHGFYNKKDHKPPAAVVAGKLEFTNEVSGSNENFLIAARTDSSNGKYKRRL